MDIQIKKASELSYNDFVNQYLNPGVPVMIRGALAEMGASQWTPKTLRSRYPDKEFHLNNQPVSLAEIIDRIENNSNNPAPPPYLTNVNISSAFPDLASDLSHAPIFSHYNWRNNRLISRLLGYSDTTCQFFLGGVNSGFPFLHVDYPPMHTFSALFYGQKEWIILHPDQSEKLYSGVGEAGWPMVSKIDNAFNPDLEKYPLAADLESTRVIQQAGDLLFVPTGWWHTTRNLSTTITVAWDHLNSSSWEPSVKWRLESIKHRNLLLQISAQCGFRLLKPFANLMERCWRLLQRQDSSNIL